MKKKLKTTTIVVDKEVWKEIHDRIRVGERDSKNKVLRRLLRLDKDNPIMVIEGKAEIRENPTLNKYVTVINENSLLEWLEMKLDLKYPCKIRVTVEVIE